MKMNNVVFNLGAEIRRRTIKNLLKAQERIADEGSAMENIKIAKCLLKASKVFNGDIEQFSFEEDKQTGD